MHSQPPKSPLSGGLWKLRVIGKCLLISPTHYKSTADSKQLEIILNSVGRLSKIDSLS